MGRDKLFGGSGVSVPLPLVILSEEFASRSEANSQSKDPYPSKRAPSNPR
jgi:hypothetical protein